MANKNTAGNLLKRAMVKETRLVKVIDKREANGTNRENTYNKFRYTANGERVWSY